jgi:hypothetical protein
MSKAYFLLGKLYYPFKAFELDCHILGLLFPRPSLFRHFKSRLIMGLGGVKTSEVRSEFVELVVDSVQLDSI